MVVEYVKLKNMDFITSITLTEWIGYLASFFVSISFFMKDIKKLRFINTIGCILFIYYGFLLENLPIIIPNVVILVLNVYHLFIKKEN